MNTMSDREYPAIEEFVPHRGRMLLLDRIVAANEKGLEAELHVSSSAWYCDPTQGMPAWLGIELMAQAIAAHVTYASRARGASPKPGVLLGTRAYRTSVPAFECGTRLRVTVREVYLDAAGFAVYDCEISDASRPLADASIKAFQPEDFGQFLAQASA